MSHDIKTIKKKEEIELTKGKYLIVKDKTLNKSSNLTWGLVFIIILNLIPIIVCIVAVVIAINNKHDFKFMYFEWEVFVWAMYIEIIVWIIVIIWLSKKFGGGKFKGITKMIGSGSEGGIGGFSQKIQNLKQKRKLKKEPQQLNNIKIQRARPINQKIQNLKQKLKSKKEPLQLDNIRIQRARPISRYLIGWIMYVVILCAIVIPIIVMLVCVWIASENDHKFKFMHYEFELFFWSLNVWFLILFITLIYLKIRKRDKGEKSGGIFSKIKGITGRKGESTESSGGILPFKIFQMDMLSWIVAILMIIFAVNLLIIITFVGWLPLLYQQFALYLWIMFFVVTPTLLFFWYLDYLADKS